MPEKPFSKENSKKNKIFVTVWLIVFFCGSVASIYFARNIKENFSYSDESVKEQNETFRLEEGLYSGSRLKEIKASEFEKHVKNKENFIVMAHMDYCPAEMPLTSVTKEFVHNSGLTVYGLSSDEFKKTSMSKTVKYLPSAAIYKNGQIVDFMDAESNDDLPAYQSVEGFSEWLSAWVQF